MPVPEQDTAIKILLERRVSSLLQGWARKWKLFQSLQEKQGFSPAQQHTMARVPLLPKVYGPPQPGREFVVVGDAGTTQYCCWHNANLGKTQICTAFGEKEDAYECQGKWHCQIDGKLTAKNTHLLMKRKESKYREKRAQQQERGSGRGVQQPTHRLDSLHQPQRDSFLDASVGSQSN